MMKKVRFAILAVLGAFCGLCAFSYISGLEEGLKENWMVLVVIGSGGLCYGLCRYWGKRGKLPDELLDDKNDRV